MSTTAVTLTRAATSPVAGRYEAVETPVTDWDTGQAVGTRTVYRAHLADGTPAGTPISWGDGLAPATNTYPTEAKARAGIRKAHRHLAAIRAELSTIRTEATVRASAVIAVTPVADESGRQIGTVRTRRDGRHSAAILTAHGRGYLPLEDYDTHADAEAAVRTHLIGA